ncbi:methyltransferase [Sphingomonas sp. ASV193]|uniref:methyltransferase n=1 Tax=Sphingomonas sp. ASV193 TaxID=3144405 RepID=UPI0032E901A4
MNKFTLGLALGAALLPASIVAKVPHPTPIAAADAAHRTPDNVKLDDGRKPAAVLAFMGLRPGMRVGDMVGINKYWAELTSPIVGPRGHVTVWEPTQFLNDKSRAAFDAFARTHPNVSLITSPFEDPRLPSNAFDAMLINTDYHDTYWQNAKYGVVRQDPRAWARKVFAAIRPGGTLVVIDHVAKAGSDPRQSVEAMHRIDPAVLRADFLAAGFRLAATSDLLRNPADDHGKEVFDPAVRGHTDRAMFKFVKPRR